MTDVAHRLRFWRSRPITADFYDKRDISLRETLTDASDRITQLEAALSSAQADREALMKVVRKVRVMSGTASVNDHGEWVVQDDAYDALAQAWGDLPERLRSEAEGKGAP